MSNYYRHEDIIGMIEEGFSIDTDEDRAYVIDELLHRLPTIEVSEDCISREQFREQMYHRCFEVDNDENMQKWDSGNWLRWKLFEEELENAPSVVPKDHSGESTEMVGEWIKEMHTNKVQIWKCDQCAEMIEQSIQYEYPRWNFCPNCGAKMKG